MEHQAFERARQARDPRFDGRFYIGVKTTGIYCRPICRVRLPKAENITFYASAAAAATAGFRPCLRCRPESAPGTPAWAGTSTTVSRALTLIGEGALDEHSVSALSDRLGVTPRHLSRLFQQHLGASPMAIAQTRRLHTARTLLDQTRLPVTQIAFLAGYGSVRRFNAHFSETYGRSPSCLRRQAQPGERGSVRLRLAYRPPFDFAGILGFLAMRGIPGVETVTATRYARAIVLNGSPGHFSVEHEPERRTVVCDIQVQNPVHLMRVVAGIKAVFDLDADPLEINQCLQKDPVLSGLVDENPGQRVPGAWDPFEIAVRAIVGQQISVRGATTVMGRIALQYGTRIDQQQYFPTPAQLAVLRPEDLPMPRGRAQAIKSIAIQANENDIDISRGVDSAALIAQLIQIKGIGGWTARYIAMRALGDPDAFLHDDLVLLRTARQQFDIDNGAILLARSLAWQPWRAYAGMHLWRQAAGAPPA
jgi:AraC family transcriptional regulator of adaptative response / DNA-3-methyladenine glycosylase II